MRISDWSSDVCSSDLQTDLAFRAKIARRHVEDTALEEDIVIVRVVRFETERGLVLAQCDLKRLVTDILHIGVLQIHAVAGKIRSEEHTSELQSLMRISYAVFCLKKKTKLTKNTTRTN